MTYNEWRDELKSNLLCVSESERRRVLDYYAEAYADRRDAGFSEREIIEDFGAPYDAAKRILSDNKGDYFDPPEEKKTRREEKREERERREERESYAPPPPPPSCPAPVYAPPPPPPAKTPKSPGTDYTWVFVLLCIIFCVPLFMLIMAMVVVTVGLCIAPIAVVASGAAIAGSSIGVMISGELYRGVAILGSGLIVFGIGIVLFPVFYKLVKLMWFLFNKVFAWIRSLFKGKKEYA